MAFELVQRVNRRAKRRERYPVSISLGKPPNNAPSLMPICYVGIVAPFAQSAGILTTGGWVNMQIGTGDDEGLLRIVPCKGGEFSSAKLTSLGGCTLNFGHIPQFGNQLMETKYCEATVVDGQYIEIVLPWSDRAGDAKVSLASHKPAPTALKIDVVNRAFSDGTPYGDLKRKLAKKQPVTVGRPQHVDPKPAADIGDAANTLAQRNGTNAQTFNKPATPPAASSNESIAVSVERQDGSITYRGKTAKLTLKCARLAGALQAAHPSPVGLEFLSKKIFGSLSNGREVEGIAFALNHQMVTLGLEARLMKGVGMQFIQVTQ